MNKITENVDICDMIDIILRQTNYDQDTALDKLTKYNNDTEAVIREYMKPDKTPISLKKNKITTNQMVYREMRTMLDSVEKTKREKNEGAV